jgi:hypothetical protein
MSVRRPAQMVHTIQEYDRNCDLVMQAGTTQETGAAIVCGHAGAVKQGA